MSSDNACPGCIIADDVFRRRGLPPAHHRAATELVRDDSGAEIDMCWGHAPLHKAGWTLRGLKGN